MWVELQWLLAAAKDVPRPGFLGFGFLIRTQTGDGVNVEWIYYSQSCRVKASLLSKPCSTVGAESRSFFLMSDPRFGGNVSLKGSLFHMGSTNTQLSVFHPNMRADRQYSILLMILVFVISPPYFELAYIFNLQCIRTYHCNYIYTIFIWTMSVYIDGYRWIALSVYSYIGHLVFIEICPWMVVYWNILSTVQAYYKNRSHMEYYSGML